MGEKGILEESYKEAYKNENENKQTQTDKKK